jgi:hypothetical protein
MSKAFGSESMFSPSLNFGGTVIVSDAQAESSI